MAGRGKDLPGQGQTKSNLQAQVNKIPIAGSPQGSSTITAKGLPPEGYRGIGYGVKGPVNQNPIQHKKHRHPPGTLFTSIFGTAIFADKWQKAMTEDRQMKIVEMFTVPRDDPFDVYKVNSQIATQTIAEMPFEKPLNDSLVEMLHEIAINYDYGCQLDVIEAYRPVAFVSHESKEQLARLPTWLRFLIIFRYDLIHAKFGHHTHHFIKILANYVETRRTTAGTGASHLEHEHEGIMDEDAVDTGEIISKFLLTERDIDSARRPTNELLEGGHQNQSNRDSVPSADADNQTQQEDQHESGAKGRTLSKSDLFKIRNAVDKWKIPKRLEADWAPVVIHRAATTLRRALLTQPLPAETLMVAEDEKLDNSEKGRMKFEDDDDEEDYEKGSNINKKRSWEDIIGLQVGFKEEIAMLVEQDLHRIPKGLPKEERLEEERLADQVALKNHAPHVGQRKTLVEKLQSFEFVKHRKAVKEKNKDLKEKAPFRKYSNIWFKNCPMEPIKQAKRFPHHFRCDESFHAYVLALVGSALFKTLIMIAIISNALSLAFETGLTKNYRIFFDVLDNLFLSIYLVEFLLKVYAHPYHYWASGFNLFDFGILSVSLVQAIFSWLQAKNLGFLKLLVIFRALRILRGISMSVHIQVLITALVTTLKTHVLSVLILLGLLMYITAIMAFNLFSETPELHEPWGNILTGMLRLFQFVTMDGWTDTSEQFDRAGHTHTGRFFCLVCILVGNFLISNIFIAIIIMQISEATEAFRTLERDEREEIIAVKKEVVFRRQKLDMRQLLAKQKISSTADFYYLGSQFMKLLRHDDLVEMENTQFSPLWMDSFYKTVMRCHHTANILMNLHRQMADNLLEMHRKNEESRYTVTPIRRSRYNRYMVLKAKLAMIRQEFYKDLPSYMRRKAALRVNIGKGDGQGGVGNKGPGWEKENEQDANKMRMSSVTTFDEDSLIRVDIMDVDPDDE